MMALDSSASYGSFNNIYTNSTHPGVLTDVTSGSNNYDGETQNCYERVQCTAGTGYDGPTGLGTPLGVSVFTSNPVNPTITGPAWVNKGQAVTVSGTAGAHDRIGIYFIAPNQTVAKQLRTLVASSTGHFSTTYTAAIDEAYQVVDGNRKSAFVHSRVRLGATTVSVTNHVGTIRGVAGNNVMLYIHKNGTGSTDFHIHALAKIDSQGNWSYSKKLDAQYSVYGVADGVRTPILVWHY